MAVDRITQDMRNMAKSYNAPRPIALMQDKLRETKHSVRTKVGDIKNAREAAKGQIKGQVSGAVASIGKSVVQGATAAAKSIDKGFESQKRRNDARHREMLNTQLSQTNMLTNMNTTIGGIHGMMHKDRYGPKVEEYKRNTGGDVAQLADQLGRQHNEIMQELKKIRKALVMGGGGSIFDMLGGLRGGRWGGGGGGGNRRNRGGGNNRSGGRRGGLRGGWGGGSSSSNNQQNRPGQTSSARDASRGGRPPSATRTQSSSTSSWSRAGQGSNTGSNSTPTIRGGGWRGRALDVGLKTAAAVGTGFAIFGGGDNDNPLQGRPVSNTPYTGLGSISASNESTRGVHEISSGRGDHGGVSYGTHQLASNNGSMQAFLDSPEGQPFAAAFGGARPGSRQFNDIYRNLARNYEREFAEAQSNYIKRTHYEPMLDNVMRGSGFDASGRGPAIQEMLYSTGVQYGTGTSVINRALANHNPNSMTDEEIIRVVQDYKGKSVESYFRSSSRSVRESVRRRAYREMDQLLALNAQYERGELGEEWGDYSSQGGNQIAAASTPSQSAQPSASVPPLMEASGTGTGLVTAVGAAGAVAAVGGASVLSSTPSATTAPVSAPTPSQVLETRNASVTPANRAPTPPAQRSAPAGPPRVTATQASVQTPPATIAAPSASVSGSASATPNTPANTPAKTGGVRGAAGRVPVLGIGLGVLDVAEVVTDDDMTTGEKAGAVTDIAGGTVGGIAGAKAGAAAGGAVGLLAGPAAPIAVPVGAFIGGLLGGFGGYWAGTEATHAVRTWAGEKLFDEDGNEIDAEVEGEAIPATGIPTDHPSTVMPDASNDPLMQAMIRDATGIQNDAERPGSSTLEDAQTGQAIAIGAIESATQIASTLAAAEGRSSVDSESVDAARQTGEVDQDTPVVVNNFNSGETGEVESSGQVAQAAAAPAGTNADGTPITAFDADSEGDSFLLDNMSQMLFGTAMPALSATRPGAPDHMRQNLHGSGANRSGPNVGAAVAGAAGAAATAGIAATAFDDDSEGNSFLLNQMSQMIFGTTLPGLDSTRPDAPEHMRQNLHGYTSPEPEEPVRPTTVREGNTVRHDFTNRPAPERPNTGQEITADDLATRPVGTSSSVNSALAEIQEASRIARQNADPLNQMNLAVNDLHANLAVQPISARSAMSASGSRVRGQVSPAPGTAPGFMGELDSSPIRVSSSSSSTSTASYSSGASDVTAQAVSDVPSRRQQHDSVQKVMMVEPQAQTHERKDLTQDPRMASTSSTYEGRHHQPSIDETPAIVGDFGLTLLNTGFI